MTWIVLIFAASSLVLIAKNVQPLWMQYLVLAVSLALFIVSLVRGLPSPQKFQGWLKKKGGIFILFFFLAVLNLVARKYEQVADLSQSKVYALRQESINWLAKVKEPVKILIFIQNDDKSAPYADWLRKQIHGQTPNIEVEVKSINKEILLAQKYGVNRTGETVLTAGERWVKVGSFKEDILMPGLARLLSKTTLPLCFLIGHGEPDIQDPSPDGLVTLKNRLEDRGYKIEAVSLDQSSPEVVEGKCSALFVISSRTSFYSQEETSFQKLVHALHLPLLLALDPPVSPSVTRILKEEGLVLTSHLVINKENLKQRIPLTEIFLYPPTTVPHTPLTVTMDKKLYLPEVQGLELVEAAKNISVNHPSWTSFLTTPPGVIYNLLEDEAKPGPFTLAASSTKEVEGDLQPKMVVFGTGKIFQTKNLNYGDNQQMLVLAIRWLLEEKENIPWISEKAAEERYMILEPWENFWIKNLSLYGLPAFAFLCTFLFWLRRQIKG